MKYEHIHKGIFLSRPNRFIAMVSIDGIETVCHVKNTGRCRELLIPGVTVYLNYQDKNNRKTKFDLVAVEKGNVLINLDSQAPNKVFYEFAPKFDNKIIDIHPEYSFGNSRIDFCLEYKNSFHLVEVKGVTLENQGHAQFPDAPTERGIKHLKELELAVSMGYRATIFFVVQLENAIDFSPNDVTHYAFGQALRHAYDYGVRVVAYSCKVSESSLEIYRQIPVLL